MTTLPPPASASPCRLYALDPADALDAVRDGRAVLVDVREPFERAGAFIAGSQGFPLSSFDPAALQAAHPGVRLVFQCKSGARSADAAQRFARAAGTSEAWTLTGGIDAWMAAGLAVERAAHAPRLDVMRQVQIVAGGLVLLGVAGSVLLHPGVIGLSGFVGAGLVFAGVTGWCGMARLLACLPWNRVPAASGAACATGRRDAHAG